MFFGKEVGVGECALLFDSDWPVFMQHSDDKTLIIIVAKGITRLDAKLYTNMELAVQTNVL